jgi:hypothetical protein
MSAAEQLGILIPPQRRRRKPDETPGGALVVTVGRRSAWIRGRGAVPLANDLEIPSMWCPFRHCLTVPRSALDDVLALAEVRHRKVILQREDRPASIMEVAQ